MGAAWRKRAETGAFLLDPDDPKSRAGERLIVLVACCEAVLLLGAFLLGLWVYLHAE